MTISKYNSEGYLDLTAHDALTAIEQEQRSLRAFRPIVERELGLFFGNALMSKCSEIWVFGSRISAGMQTEINRAKWKNYRLRYFTEDCQEV